MEDDLGIEDSLEVYARYFIDAIQRGLSIPAQWVGGANDLPSSSSLPVVAAVHIYYEIGDTKMSTAIQVRYTFLPVVHTIYLSIYPSLSK